MFLFFPMWFGCATKTIETTPKPPLKPDNNLDLKNSCLANPVEGCEKVKAIRIALDELTQLHEKQMAEMQVLVVQFNSLLNKKEIPPILNVDFEQPQTNDWRSPNQKSSIKIDTRVQYISGIDRIPEMTKEEMTEQAKQIKLLQEQHIEAYKALERKYSIVDLPENIAREREPIRVSIRYLIGEVTFEVPKKFKPFINRMILPLRAEVALSTQVNDTSFRVIAQQDIPIISPLTVSCSENECSILEGEKLRSKFEHEFTYTIDHTCAHLQPEIHIYREGEKPELKVNFTSKY